MTSRNGRGRGQRVLEAREQARVALGYGPAGGDLYGAPKCTTAPSAPPMPNWTATRREERPDESVRVLSLSEAAARLQMNHAELERMIAKGEIESLPTGFTKMIPSREVTRLTRP